MSVEAPKPVEETPVIATPETTEAQKTAMAAPDTTQPSEAERAVLPATEESIKPGEAVVEATPASEGVLGYKEPGLLKKLKGYQKHFFWLGEEPVESASLLSYTRNEKSGQGHHNASWATQTGKGVLFYSKREEDKATPAGLIMLSEISKITKEGETEFQFKEGHSYQKFHASSSAERDSWLVALEKQSEEAKAMKEGIVGSEGYKSSLASYASPALVSTTAAQTTETKKELDASTTPAAATATDGVAHEDTVAEEEEAAKKGKASSRSRSRGNRKSFFGGLLDKKEKTEENKELKKEEKAEEKAEKKEAKKEIKEEKKEEAKANHDSKAKEAAEVAAVGAVPAAAVVAEKKHEDKKEEKSEAATPTEKKSKRGSVFGSIFAKKNVTSPDAEKTESEAGPAVPVKDTDVPPVSETAPKIEKPVEQKPLDTAAVVAPVDTVQTPAAVEEPKNEKPTTPTETTSTPKEKKEGGGFLGFIKKQEAKLPFGKDAKSEAKEEKAADEVSKDPVAAAAIEPTTETPATTEERPVNPQRRSSLLERFGTQRKRANKTSDTEDAPAEPKQREKSPLPQKVAGLFRKPSKAVKPTEEKPAAETNGLTNGHSETAAISEATEETKPNVTVPEAHDSTSVGDVVPENLQGSVHNAVTATPEIKATA